MAWWPGGSQAMPQAGLTAPLCPQPVPQTLAAARAGGPSSCPRGRPVAHGVGNTRQICFSEELIFYTFRKTERHTEAFRRSRLMKWVIYSTRDGLRVWGVCSVQRREWTGFAEGVSSSGGGRVKGRERSGKTSRGACYWCVPVGEGDRRGTSRCL